MTTNVIGFQWNATGTHLVPVVDNLDWKKGSSVSFDSFNLNPNDLGSFLVTDAPNQGLIYSEDPTVSAQVNGEEVNISAKNYSLIVGETLLATGPEIDGKQAKLFLKYIPSESQIIHNSGRRK